MAFPVGGNKTTLCSEPPEAFIRTARVFFYCYILKVGLFKIEMFELNCNSEILMRSDGPQTPW